MTQPKPPSGPSAHEVAKLIDRRRMRRKVAGGGLLAAFAALAATYVTCGRDFGLAGGGYRLDDGDGGPGSARVEAPPARCALRVTATGVTVDGKPATRDEAVTTCKSAGGADVVVTGAAREGDWKDLRTALEAAGVTFSVR